MKKILTVLAMSAVMVPGGVLAVGRETVERKLQIVSTRMCEVQTSRVGAMKRHLAKMSKILDRVTARAQSAKTSGKNVAAVDAAVAKARVAITEAELAVVESAEKNCEIEAAGTNVGSGVAVIRRTMQFSLGGAQRKVSGARKAVSESIRALAHVLGGV